MKIIISFCLFYAVGYSITVIMHKYPEFKI